MKNILGIFFLSLVVGFLVFLGAIALQDLNGPNRSGAVQAYAAILTFLVSAGLLFLNASAEARAKKADERAERSEIENEKLRKSAVEQAASMARLAEASGRQADLLALQQAEDRKVRLHLVDVGEVFTLAGVNGERRRRPKFSLVNMSTYGVFVRSISFLTTPGTERHRVELLQGSGIGVSSLGSELLAPGESRNLSLPLVSGLQSYTGGASPILRGYAVDVVCLYPGSGETTQRFKVEWADWHDHSEVTITPIDGSGQPIPVGGRAS